MIGRLLCFVGYHNFKWSLLEDGFTIPPYAGCSRCGILYDKNYRA